MSTENENRKEFNDKIKFNKIKKVKKRNYLKFQIHEMTLIFLQLMVDSFNDHEICSSFRGILHMDIYVYGCICIYK